MRIKEQEQTTPRFFRHVKGHCLIEKCEEDIPPHTRNPGRSNGYGYGDVFFDQDKYRYFRLAKSNGSGIRSEIMGRRQGGA
ncbi:hypothetical protein NOR_04005 [Metarhizium rileyi]|uniref:Uncharacterized protein n=1 Tax=Metarhizium rileyi (strain RCEF 4871) TaxID=1649241 RepID=A0A167EQJ3_METRR|nr:hypothetical protein NOR_04005 [Metarhizium rileyi RCEF 4871]